MGNFSKDPQAVLQEALEKGYIQVYFQQGKPLLDRELNLLGDLASPQRLAEHHLGNGVPIGSDGFHISNLNVATHDFTIGAGRCLVKGYEVVLATNTTYKTQPHLENVKSLPPGASQVYLRVFWSEVTGTQDSSLLNSGDVGFETSVRKKVDWEVWVTSSVITASDHFLLAVIDTSASSVQDRRRTGLTLATVRDELTLARGSANQLGNRLDTSLMADGGLKANSVGNAQIANNSVTTDKIAGSAIVTGKISDNAVTESKIADNAVTTNKIADNAITGNKILAAAVSTNKITDNAITTNKITNNAVTEDKIADDAVTQAKIAKNAVALSELKQNLVFNGSVSIGPQLETSLTLIKEKRHAHLLISAFISGTSAGPSGVARISWTDFYSQSMTTTPPITVATIRGVRIRNESSLTITVEVQAFELLPN